MSDAARRLRIAMLDQKISRQQLAQNLDVKITTLGNIIRGGRCSPALKKKIQAFLRVRIWEDTPIELLLNNNFEFVFPSVKGQLTSLSNASASLGLAPFSERALNLAPWDS